MEIDYEKARHWRQYRDEPCSFRGLSLITKAVAAYCGNLVDPAHGWLQLRGDSVAKAFRAHAAGRVTRSDCRLLERSIGELLDEGFLVRCRVLDNGLGKITTHDQRDVELSSWLEDPGGEWVVIADWVPAQNGLNREDTTTWHAARRDRYAAAAAAATATTTTSAT